MNSAQSIPRPSEAMLKPSLALALDLTRRAGGINNYEAEQRIHYGVVRYACLGWERPQPKQSNSEVTA